MEISAPGCSAQANSIVKEKVIVCRFRQIDLPIKAAEGICGLIVQMKVIINAEQPVSTVYFDLSPVLCGAQNGIVLFSKLCGVVNFRLIGRAPCELHPEVSEVTRIPTQIELDCLF